MGTEIERKFLVDDSFHPQSEGRKIVQGYLTKEPHATVRVRLVGAQGFLTIKGKTEGIRRSEYEYEIPRGDAQDMLDLCRGTLVEKVRYEVPVGDHLFEVDVFEGRNEGLTVAEIELDSEEEEFERPSWLGEEVSSEARYRNSALAEWPYCQWHGGKARQTPREG